MKALTRLLIVFCAANAMALVAFAGPESLPSGKEMKEVAPVPPACPNWTGFYVGGFGGYKFGATDINLDLTGDWATSAPFDKTAIQEHSPSNLDTSGAEIGGLIGYNYEFQNHLVLGVEGTGGYLWLRKSDASDIFTIVQYNNTYTVHTSLETNYLATFGPRIGYAFCKWMPYVTGGLAIGNIDYRQNIAFFDNTPHDHEIGARSDTNLGWMVGGGLQYAICSHWSARLQYQFDDLGSIHFHSIDQNFPTFTGTHDVSLNEHNVSAAIIFQF
jgi:outer membrane immunogenic protein